MAYLITFTSCEGTVRYPRNLWTISASAAFPSSSVYDHRVSNILDNSTGNDRDIFASLYGQYHWFQIDFGEIITGISYVEFFKRPNNNVYGDRFRQVTIKIGNYNWSAIGGLEPIDVNKQCGGAGSAPSSIFRYWFKCSSKMTGRFLTTQSAAYTHLEADEVYIHS